ncbi:JAB domain-containing protein [Salinimicrobium sp. MT39]|uniref:JAB domain-containing protein n=1 Tax=Salinimicrobium profundisediminis TaxID=2994553 RepID=A0A9X3I1G7_9FLAO|nr:JAB domain-containing protein [Salinimicrobium profundisediminis]MCX2839060.1 JAB domain-containing protein [Salinimicrobium profundisediminis]
MKTKVNEISLKYLGNMRIKESPKISSSNDAFEKFYCQWNLNHIAMQECFKLMLLNNGNRVKGIVEISTGGITATLVDLRILFAVALKSLATAIIVAHNHPSGTLLPSQDDKTLTRKIKEAGLLLDIKLLDHLIITPEGKYFSFADEGIL